MQPSITLNMYENCMFCAPGPASSATGRCLNGQGAAYTNTPQETCKASEEQRDRNDVLMKLTGSDGGMTNGDVLKFMFPRSYYEVRAQVVIFEFGGVKRELPIGWWNQPYLEFKEVMCCDNCRYSTSPELRETFCFGCKEANGWAPREGADV